jgi:hypothetical protein
MHELILLLPAVISNDKEGTQRAGIFTYSFQICLQSAVLHITSSLIFLNNLKLIPSSNNNKTHADIAFLAEL